ncbi:MAG: 50S ribosomal protein L9 [Opitutales bacterium]|nr:50S ribosomal protein L9 [Opitutales bacterium]
MALSEVLLKKPVAGLGAEGDQVKVKAGFARNFLLPQGIAVPVNQANRKQIEALKKARAVREAKELDDARAFAEKLSGLEISFTVKSGDDGKMFGSISTTDISKKLAELGHEIAKKQIHLEHGSIKTLGKSAATIKLHPEVSVEITVELVPEALPEKELVKGKKTKGRKAASREEAPAEEAAPAAE